MRLTDRHFPHRVGGRRAPTECRAGTRASTASRKRFGLRLESHREAIEMMIIDRVERPDEN